MVGRRIVQASPDVRICRSASSRTRLLRAGRVVVTAVVEMNTARSRPADRAAPTMTGACPKPSDARLTSASQSAAANTPGSWALSSRSPVSGLAPRAATACAAASLRASATVS